MRGVKEQPAISLLRAASLSLTRFARISAPLLCNLVDASTPLRAGDADRALEVVTGVKVHPLGCDASLARWAARRSLIAAACACNASGRFSPDHFVEPPLVNMRACACFSRRCCVSILALKAARRLSASPWSRLVARRRTRTPPLSWTRRRSWAGTHFGGRCFLFLRAFVGPPRRDRTSAGLPRVYLWLPPGSAPGAPGLRVRCLPRSGALRRGDAAAAAIALS